MKPAWDKLMKEYKGHATAGVFDVDCTSSGKPLCDANGVQGFPTIKYGDPSALEAYEGGRDFDSLQTFAKENLKPMCSPANIDLCDDDKKKQIEDLSAMSGSDLEDKIAEKTKEMEDAEKNFKDEVSKLQKKYEKLMKAKDDAIKAVKESGLGLMKAVKAHKAKASKEEL
jgi:hypothetical protein